MIVSCVDPISDFWITLLQLDLSCIRIYMFAYCACRLIGCASCAPIWLGAGNFFFFVYLSDPAMGCAGRGCVVRSWPGSRFVFPKGLSVATHRHKSHLRNGGKVEGKGKDIREGRSYPIRSLREAETINFRAGSAIAGKQRIDVEPQALEAVVDIVTPIC